METLQPRYDAAVEYLYSQTPQFCQIGAAAYKPGLDTVRQLAAAFGNPQQQLRCIHIAGTNGKGSTAHSLAAVLQAAGYKVGLYTSPHLVDFRERIRVDGLMISQQDVADFVEQFRAKKLQGLEPSFFELTTVMAFQHFADRNVDVAIIEVGLGGRLDSTNIITPELSIITNISLDHTAQLGNTLAAIASEKAGIIKPQVPVIIGERQEETTPVFTAKAQEVGAPIHWASQVLKALPALNLTDDGLKVRSKEFGEFTFQLSGECQRRNILTILAAIMQLQAKGWNIPQQAIHQGLENVCQFTGLMGRWMKVSDHPLTICDTGHNPGGWQYLSQQLQHAADTHRLVMVIGFVNDKDISHILPSMPRQARYIFTQASIPRAMPAQKVQATAAEFGITGIAVNNVAKAYAKACEMLRQDSDQLACDMLTPMVFVGGSTFVVADFLKSQNFCNFALR